MAPQRVKISHEEYFNEYVLGLAHQMNEISDLKNQPLESLQEEYAKWEVSGTDESPSDVNTDGMSVESLVIAIYDYRVFN